jgi:8-oxo-dGTP pyrophosphatase MutT (NUDIX family)
MTKDQYSAAKAIIVRDGKVLLLRQSMDPGTSNSGAFHLPGGIIEGGETAEEAISREVKEETGLTVRAIRPIGMGEWNVIMHGRPSHFDGVFFECEIQGEMHELSLDVENDAYVWVSLSEIADTPIAEPSRRIARDYLASHRV